jgi:hypothetical protein
MSDNIFSFFFTLPSVKRFAENISEKLINGISCLILVPDTVPIDYIYQGIYQNISKKCEWIDFIDPYYDFPDSRPLNVLENVIGIKWKDFNIPRTFAKIPDYAELPETLPELILIENLYRFDSKKREEWLMAIKNWAGISKTYKDKGESIPAICAVLNATHNSKPQDDALFCKTYCWWGMPTITELKVLAKSETQFEHSNDFPLWREYILPWLGIGDLYLFSELSDINKIDEEQISKTIIEIAQARKWKNTDLIDELNAMESFSKSILGFHSMVPPSNLWKFWANGILGFCPDCGIVISPVALSLMGRLEEIKHRIWIAQCEALLPILDRCRLALCEILNKGYGSDWPLAYLQPMDKTEKEALTDSSFNCQFGHMETVVNNWPRMALTKKIMGSSIYKFRKVRNLLAHNVHLSYPQFKSFISAVNEFKNKI